MAHVEPPPSVPEVQQASGETEALLPASSPCTGGQQMDQPPPYMLSPPTYTPYPAFDPQSPALEPHPDPSYQQSMEGQLVVDGCGIQVSAFEDKSIRRAFIRKVSPGSEKDWMNRKKVFCMVTLQLLFSFSVVCVFTFSSRVKECVQANIWIMISSYIVFTVVSLCLLLCRSFSRLHPWNLVGLGLVTLSLSYMVGTVASNFDTPAVIIAMGSTLATSFAIIVFSSQAKVDFTVCNGILVVLSANLVMFGFFSIFYYSNILPAVYGFLGALLFSLFLVVDCQLVMGRQTYSLSPEEYVFGALIVYLDIMYIFMYILILFGGGSRN